MRCFIGKGRAYPGSSDHWFLEMSESPTVMYVKFVMSLHAGQRVVPHLSYRRQLIVAWIKHSGRQFIIMTKILLFTGVQMLFFQTFMHWEFYRMYCIMFIRLPQTKTA